MTRIPVKDVAKSLGEAIVASTVDGVVGFDLQQRVVMFNPAAERIFGTTGGEILGQSIGQLIPERYRQMHARALASLAKTGDDASPPWGLAEMIGLRADGEEIPLEASFSQIGVNGEKVFIAVLREISERKRAERELALREQRYRALAENSSEMIDVLDASGTIVYENLGAERTLGFAPMELVGRNAFELVHPEDLDRTRRTFEQVLRQPGSMERIEVRLRVRSGGWRVGEIIAKNLLHDPAVRGIVLNSRDVTARKQAEEALKEAQALLEMRVQERTAELRASHEALAESEERYRRLFQAVSDAVIVMDVETKRIVDVNDAALRLFGYTREEFLKLTHLDLTTEPEKASAAIRAAAAGELSHVPIRYHRKKDKTVFPVEISNSTFKVRNRLMLCGLIRDITERLELEREILAISEQEQRRLGQDLHDDLCQQLAGIEFLSQTLAGSIAGKCKVAAAKAKEIAQMVQRAMAQTRDLARGLAPVSLERDGLALALQELTARTSRVFLIDCRCRCNGQMPQLEAGAAVHLYRIAQEAVGNAIKHGKARRIGVSLAADGNRLTLRVEDDGAGIPQKASRRSGMGLRIMQYRAEVMGGSLTLERAPRGGTTLVCMIPEVLQCERQPTGDQNDEKPPFEQATKTNPDRR